jgi:hypothetical protein
VEFLSRVVPKLISAIISIIDASNLRERMYQQQHEHEIMWTALDDIQRMYPEHGSAKLANQTLKSVNTRYGR